MSLTIANSLCKVALVALTALSSIIVVVAAPQSASAAPSVVGRFSVSVDARETRRGDHSAKLIKSITITGRGISRTTPQVKCDQRSCRRLSDSGRIRKRVRKDSVKFENVNWVIVRGETITVVVNRKRRIGRFQQIGYKNSKSGSLVVKRSGCLKRGFIRRKCPKGTKNSPQGAAVGETCGKTWESNLLKNGGFEEGGANWTPLPWAGGTVTFQPVLDKTAQEGSRHLNSGTSSDAGSVFQDVSFSPASGDRVTLSTWIRLTPGTPVNGQKVGMCVWSLPAQKNSCVDVSPNATWQKVSIQHPVTGGSTQLRVQYYMYGRGGIDFDDAILTRNLLRNGSFEAGSDAWGTNAAWGTTTVNYTTYENASFAHEGVRYLEANSSADDGSVLQDIPFSAAAGDPVTFSIWARLNPGIQPQGQKVLMCIWSFPATKNTCAEHKLGNPWQLVSVTAPNIAGTTAIRAELYMAGRGNYDFDDGWVGDSCR